jgi:hypothetical protein
MGSQTLDTYAQDTKIFSTAITVTTLPSKGSSRWHDYHCPVVIHHLPSTTWATGPSLLESLRSSQCVNCGHALLQRSPNGQ